VLAVRAKPEPAKFPFEFKNTQRASGGGEAAAINHLHKVEEVVQVKHSRIVHLIGR
jgi:hypothetical protein